MARLFHKYLHQALDQMPTLSSWTLLRIASYGISLNKEKTQRESWRWKLKKEFLCKNERKNDEKKMDIWTQSIFRNSLDDWHSYLAPWSAGWPYLAILGSWSISFTWKAQLHFWNLSTHSSNHTLSSKHVFLFTGHQIFQLHRQDFILGLSDSLYDRLKSLLLGKNRFLLHRWNNNSSLFWNRLNQHVFRLTRNTSGRNPFFQTLKDDVRHLLEKER